MGQIKKLYQDNSDVVITQLTEQDAVYPITASSAVYHQTSWGTGGQNQSVSAILDSLNDGYLFLGVATQSTNPGTHNHKVFYLASENGNYSHFGGITVSCLSVLKNAGSGWSKEELNITSGGGGGGGGTVTGYIGTTEVQDSPANQRLSGISRLDLTESAKIYFGANAYIELTQYGFHFSTGVYSDSYVSAFGIDTTGGGGGGGTSYLAGDGLLIDDNVISINVGSGLGFDSNGRLYATNQGTGTVTSITLLGGTGISLSSESPVTVSGERTISLSQEYINTISGLSTTVSNLSTRVTAIEGWFEVVDGNLHVKNGRGLYSDTFIAAGGTGSGGSGGTYMAGDGIDISSSYVISLQKASAYSIGGIKVGEGLAIDSSGTLRVVNSGGGSGSVTSVAMTVPTGLSVTGTPITSSGTLAVTLQSGYVIPQQTTLNNFVTLSGSPQTITSGKTFSTSNVTLSGVSLLPAANNTGGIGSSSNRFSDVYAVEADFSSDVIIGGNLTMSYNKSISLGPVTISYDSVHHALHISGTYTESNQTKNIAIYCDGAVSAGGPETV